MCLKIKIFSGYIILIFLLVLTICLFRKEQYIMKVWILGAVGLWTICSFAQQQEVPIYLDNNQPIEKRVEECFGTHDFGRKSGNDPCPI